MTTYKWEWKAYILSVSLLFLIRNKKRSVYKYASDA